MGHPLIANLVGVTIAPGGRPAVASNDCRRDPQPPPQGHADSARNARPRYRRLGGPRGRIRHCEPEPVAPSCSGPTADETLEFATLRRCSAREARSTFAPALRFSPWPDPRRAGRGRPMSGCSSGGCAPCLSPARRPPASKTSVRTSSRSACSATTRPCSSVRSAPEHAAPAARWRCRLASTARSSRRRGRTGDVALPPPHRTTGAQISGTAGKWRARSLSGRAAGRPRRAPAPSRSRPTA